MFTKIKVNGFVVPVQIKNSEIMLTPALALAKEGKNFKYPKLANLYEAMEKDRILPDGTVKKIDTIMFESAVKEGGIGIEKVNEKGQPVYATGETIDEASVVTLKNSDFFPTRLEKKYVRWKVYFTRN